ncbi:MAG: hypothetical protein ACFFC7_09515 [Candidatus Hermodarchaeota archaeon]
MPVILEKKEFETSYIEAREWLQKVLQTTPEDYKINNFIDPVHFWSMQQHLALGSPYAHLSSTFSRHLNYVREKGLISKKNALTYTGSPTQIYINTDRVIEISNKENVSVKHVLVPVIIKVLAIAFIVEKGCLKSTNRQYLTEIQEIDLELRTLLLNNLFFLQKETQAPWIGQYLQDFSAFTRFLTTAEFNEWHVPNEMLQKEGQQTHYSNFISEVIPALKERATIIRKCFLTDILLEGFSQFICSKYFLDLGLEPLKSFNPRFQSPKQYFAFSFMETLFSYFDHSFPDFLAFISNIQSDYHLLTALSSLDPLAIANACEKKALDHLSTTGRGIVMGAWLDFRRYLKALLTQELTDYGKLLNWRQENFQSAGFIGVLHLRKPVYIFRLDGESIAAEQLLILHNHASPKADAFSLPGVAVILGLQQIGGMKVLTRFEVDLERSKPSINNPWELAINMDSIRVVSREYDPNILKKSILPELLELNLTTDERVAISAMVSRYRLED